MGSRPAAGSDPRPWRRAALWLLFLGPFFFASYGFATWVTGLRADVGVIVFAWERHIPFLPWTIVPYWLIDLLYGLSLFLCATRRQLDTHAYRLLTAQALAVTGFLLFPLRFSFDRPEADGLFGWMFAVLGTFDRPFNQAPSLHIALAVILWHVYARAVPRAGRWVVHVAFVLIGASVLTTWQHHFVDVPTGFWLGWLCVWLFPDGARPLLAGAAWTDDPRRRRLALRYAAAAVAVGAVAVVVGGAGWWLLWGAGALGLVAAIYAGLGERAFQKRADGSLPAATWWLLGPYLAGAWLNAWWWARRLPPADPVAAGVWLGRLPSAGDATAATVVDVCAELPCRPGGAGYVHVPMLDLVVPSPEQIERASAAVEAAGGSGEVRVCCALGLSRSALVAAAWLLRSGRAVSPDEAVAAARRARPAVVLEPAHRAALQRWWAGRQGIPEGAASP